MQFAYSSTAGYFSATALAGFKGTQALKAVLKGATEMKSNSHWYREYIKKGGFKQAEKDFDKASPTNVREFSYPDGVSISPGGT